MTSYISRYPRSGQIAILCEGTVAGFEFDLLEIWTALNSHLQVDVWPCGKRASIVGMADAIGRSRPIAVIEDRDFRTLEEAEIDCARQLRDRRSRAIQVKYWKTWKRHEIENYLVEPSVLVPVLADRFSTSESHVTDRLQEVITSLGIDQAAQYILYRFKCLLSDKHPDTYIAGLPRKNARPRLDCKAGQVNAPDRNLVKDALTKTLGEKLISLKKDTGSFDQDVQKLLVEFDARCDSWLNLQANSSEWRLHWGGKEVLHLLVRLLAWECGWETVLGQGKQRIDWDMLDRAKAEALDREIESDLQPLLVESLLLQLQSTSATDIQDEWRDLATQLT